MPPWDTAITDWTTSLQAAGRSPRTITLYLCHIRKVRSAVPTSPADVTTPDLRTILAAGAWRPETRRSVRTTITSFFRWLTAEGTISTDPAARLAPVTVPAGVARPAPDDVVTEALANANPRVRTMILLGAYAGLRAAEIAAVHTRDWDGSGIYVTGKGGRTRYVPIVRDDLAAIIRQTKRDRPGYLFPGQTDGHLSPGHVCKLISRALPDGWTAHTLRHRCATAMFAGTHDLLAVGAVLGHTKPETTQRYVRLPTDALTAAIRAAA